MAKLTVIAQKLFGSSAGSDQIGKFGSKFAGSPAFTTNPAEVQQLGNFLEGWYSAAIGGNAPAIEDMNALFFLLFYQIAYIQQAGVSEWNTSTIYWIGSLVNSGTGAIYKSVIDNNVGNALTDGTKWQLVSQPNNQKNLSSSDTGLVTDYLVRCDATAGSFTYTLAAISGYPIGHVVIIKAVGGGSNQVTVASSDLMDGASTVVLDQQSYGSIQIRNNGTSWDII